MQNHETKVKIIKGECPKTESAERVYRAASKNVNIGKYFPVQFRTF